MVFKRSEAMIIVVGGVNSGSGKSTIATNLAVIRVAKGDEVALIDAGDHEASYNFTGLRARRMYGAPGYLCSKQSGLGVRSATLQLSRKYKTVIIDAGGRDTTGLWAALSVAHLLIVPFDPHLFDVEQVVNVFSESRTKNRKLLGVAFENRSDLGGRLPDLSTEALEGRLTELCISDLRIGNRLAFGVAGAEGKAVTELVPHNSNAAVEMSSLYDYVFGEETMEMLARSLFDLEHGEEEQF
jgi:chromosome partitioning protein